MLKTLGVALLLLISFTINAQLTIIPKAGINFSTMHFRGPLYEDQQVRSKFGFQCGLGLEIPLREKMFVVQPEILYSQKGFRRKFAPNKDFNADKTQYYERFHYVNIPISFKVKWRQFYIAGGPYVAYCLGANYKLHKVTSREVIWQGKIDFGKTIYVSGNPPEKYTNRIDAGAQVSAGVKIRKIYLNLGYSYGLQTLMKEVNYRVRNAIFTAEVIGKATAKNRSLQLDVSMPLTFSQDWFTKK